MPVSRKREERVEQIADDLRRWGESTAASIYQRTGMDVGTINIILRQSRLFEKTGKVYRSAVWGLVK